MKIDTITFIDVDNNKKYNSFTDFGFLVKDINISEALVQEEKIKIPGTSKIIDFSQTLSGKTNFDRRTISITLNKRADNDYLMQYSNIQNILHGQRMKIILSNDPDYYWLGTIKIGSKDLFKKVDELSLICEVDPFKYDVVASDENWIWDTFSFDYGIINETENLIVEDNLEVTIVGSRMPTYPIIECSNAMEVEFNEKTIQLLSGRQEVLDIELVGGENVLNFTGNGSVTISYRGGSL